MNKQTTDSEKMQLKLQDLLPVLNHEIRQKMLIELYDNGFASFTELKKILRLSTGVFYHHMKMLLDAGLVYQLEDKNYDLTELGITAVEWMRQELQPTKTENTLIFQFFSKFSPYYLFIAQYKLLIFVVVSLLYALTLFWLVQRHSILLIGDFLTIPHNPHAVFLNTLSAVIFTFIGFSGLVLFFFFFYRRKKDFL